MSEEKLLARNAAAVRSWAHTAALTRRVPGNPVSTRLESGVGNCFPGLECDLRNLERRFFPFVEVDISDQEIVVARVDVDGVEAAAQAGTLNDPALGGYRRLARSLAAGERWVIRTLEGDFPPLGHLTLQIRNLGLPSPGGAADREPPDAWTAIRLLRQDSVVTLGLGRAGRPVSFELQAPRARYLDPSGALATMFQPGEMTQSLCSPWTHDFRDCGCFYWASNHPDIVLPPAPVAPSNDPGWNMPVPWQRWDRQTTTPPSPASTDDPTDSEMRYFEINQRWQLLNFVLEGREQPDPYAAGKLDPTTFTPLASAAELMTHLRYAAGVELAVIQEYIAAAYSLQSPDQLAGALRDVVRTVFAEVMRIAVSEMAHLRRVNDLLRRLTLRGNAAPPPFQPALGVAQRVPGRNGTRPVQARALTKDPALADFLALEKPSVSVDGLYARILVSLDTLQVGNDEDRQTVRSIMADGADHFATFTDIAEWLRPHDEAAYLRANLRSAPAGNALHRDLQTRYADLLDRLWTGYQLGVPTGGVSVNEARAMMFGNQGIEGAARALADAGFLVAFDLPADARFASVPPPP
jgi:hypothetical protein